MNKTEITYIYDGTFEGWLSAVFSAFYNKHNVVRIAVEEHLQATFTETVMHIETDEIKAARVAQGIQNKLGELVYQKIWCAFLSYEESKETELYHYVKLGFSLKNGRTLINHLTDEHVAAVHKMDFRVNREAHLLKGFVRFNEMEGGVYYAAITPDNNVLPVIMPHFVDRFGYAMPFIIHDKTRGIAGLYAGKGWHIADVHEATLPRLGPNEAHYMRLWRGFYNAIGIKERKNPLCKRNMCPAKFWPNMLEMKPELSIEALEPTTKAEELDAGTPAHPLLK